MKRPPEGRQLTDLYPGEPSAATHLLGGKYIFYAIPPFSRLARTARL